MVSPSSFSHETIRRLGSQSVTNKARKKDLSFIAYLFSSVDHEDI